MNIERHFWNDLQEVAIEHADIKLINRLRICIENWEECHAKLYERNPLCEHARAIRGYMAEAEEEIKLIESKYEQDVERYYRQSA